MSGAGVNSSRLDIRLRYAGPVNTEAAVKLLFELHAILDRLAQSEISLQEALSDDIDRAIRLTDACIGQLTGEAPDPNQTDAEEA